MYGCDSNLRDKLDVNLHNKKTLGRDAVPAWSEEEHLQVQKRSGMGHPNTTFQR